MLETYRIWDKCKQYCERCISNTANNNQSPDNQQQNQESPNDYDARRFEHLYPNQKWQDLPKFRLRDIWYLIQLVTICPENQEINKGIEQARSHGTEFARKKIFDPSQANMKEALGNTNISTRNFHRCNFEEILEANETIGGCVEIDIDTKNQQDQLQTDELEANKNQKKTKLYMIGLIDKNTNKPRGIIYYIEGRKKDKERNLGYQKLKTNLSLSPVPIPVRNNTRTTT